ncbi:MAG: HAD family hydrolase [Vicinamibacterales bacterium]|nr:HAD family hydrolase [Vicinamibacterales bacterium]
MKPALIFDLDDTLYPERQFIRSGFHAVAAEVARRFAVSQRAALASLLRALRQGTRGLALQVLCADHQLPVALVPELVELIRTHVPVLTLPRSSANTLAAARARGWRVGVLTNGPPAQQARKVAALGLAGLVDALVYAHACGDRTGKPARGAFEAVLAELGALPASSVFVGDDPWCDISGARLAGLRTILLCRTARCEHLAPSCEPDVSVRDIGDVIAAAAHLLNGRRADEV